MAPRALVAKAGEDIEHIALHPGVCTIEGSRVICGEVLFAVKSGRRADEYESSVRSLGGVLVSRTGAATTPWLGLARVDFGDEVRLRDALRDLEGIVDAHLNFVMCQRYAGNPCSAPRGLVPTAAGTVRAEDGVLQIRSGDVVRVASVADPSVSAQIVASSPRP